MVLVEGQLTILSGVNIRLGGFHYLLSSMGSIGTRHGTDASSIMHVHSSFERDNNMQRTVLFTWHVMNGRACAKGTRVYLLSERASTGNIITAVAHCRWQSINASKHISCLCLITSRGYYTAPHSDKYWYVIWTDITMKHRADVFLKTAGVSLVGMVYYITVNSCWTCTTHLSEDRIFSHLFWVVL